MHLSKMRDFSCLRPRSCFSAFSRRRLPHLFRMPLSFMVTRKKLLRGTRWAHGLSESAAAWDLFFLFARRLLASCRNFFLSYALKGYQYSRSLQILSYPHSNLFSNVPKWAWPLVSDVCSIVRPPPGRAPRLRPFLATFLCGHPTLFALYNIFTHSFTLFAWKTTRIHYSLLLLLPAGCRLLDRLERVRCEWHRIVNLECSISLFLPISWETGCARLSRFSHHQKMRGHGFHLIWGFMFFVHGLSNQRIPVPYFLLKTFWNTRSANF